MYRLVDISGSATCFHDQSYGQVVTFSIYFAKKTPTCGLSPKKDSNKVVAEFTDFVRVYRDGRVERLKGTEVVPASVDSATGVSSKDVVIDPSTGLSARLYLPSLAAAAAADEKLPVLVYFHGGGFVIESPFSPAYHAYLNSVVACARVVAVSVHYRRAPEHPLPAAYDDSWSALRWVVSHAAAAGPDPWIADHGDFNRLFLAGDSAGGNIAHNLAMRAAAEGLGGGVEIQGIILTHPFFWGAAPVGKETADPKFRAGLESLWRLVCPSSARGVEDPALNPTAEGAPSLAGLGCRRVLVFVAAKDFLRERGRHYYEALRGSGWPGIAEVVESEGEDHVFHLFNPTSGKAAEMMEHLVAFLHGA